MWPFPRSLPSSELLCHLEELWKTTVTFAVLNLDGACGGQAHCLWNKACLVPNLHTSEEVVMPFSTDVWQFDWEVVVPGSYLRGPGAAGDCDVPKSGLTQRLATFGIGMLAVGTPGCYHFHSFTESKYTHTSHHEDAFSQFSGLFW